MNTRTHTHTNNRFDKTYTQRNKRKRKNFENEIEIENCSCFTVEQHTQKKQYRDRRPFVGWNLLRMYERQVFCVFGHKIEMAKKCVTIRIPLSVTIYTKYIHICLYTYVCTLRHIHNTLDRIYFLMYV